MSVERPTCGTSTISDALDRLGIVGQMNGVKPVGPTHDLWGPAFTIRMTPAASPPGSVGDYIDDVAPDAVVLIANDGRLDVTVWGDILTETASARGVGGTVIDGVCRDSSVLETVRYPLFSKGVHMRTGKDRVQLESVGDTVSMAGVRVGAGDMVYGDRDGVVTFPVARLGEVLDVAAEIDATEAAIRDAVRSGMSLRAARQEFGYHALQTRRDETPGTGS